MDPCPSCDGCTRCLACEGTARRSSAPFAAPCACRDGTCPTCRGSGRKPVESPDGSNSEFVCPRCGLEATVEHAGRPLDPLTFTCTCRACGQSATYDERRDDYDTFAWRRASYVTGAPPRFVCPRCGGGRIRGAGHVQRSVHEGNGAQLRCWSCDLEESDPDGSDLLARWSNPAYARWIHAQSATIFANKQRAAALRAELTRRWPWHPRIRTTPASRRGRAAVPPWLEEIVRAPDDVYLRLDAADIIEVEDPARARFIRRQIELERAIATMFSDVRTLLAREPPPALGRDSPELAVLADERVIADRAFARGFVEHVTMHAADFVAHADEVLERAPIRFLTLADFAAHAEAVVAHPAFARIRGLRLAAAARRPALDGTDEVCWMNALDDRAVATLAGADLRALVVVDVTGAKVSIDPVARAWPALRVLDEPDLDAWWLRMRALCATASSDRS